MDWRKENAYERGAEELDWALENGEISESEYRSEMRALHEEFEGEDE